MIMHQFIQQIEDIIAKSEWPVAMRMDALLKVGTNHLRMETGIVSQIRAEVYRITRCQTRDGSQFQNGRVYNIHETYGDIIMRESGLVYFDHMHESIYRAHRAYRVMRQESYIGVPLIVNGSIFGALEFMSYRGRPRPFEDNEIDVVYVMGGSLSELVERDMRIQAARATQEVHAVDERAGIGGRKR